MWKAIYYLKAREIFLPENDFKTSSAEILMTADPKKKNGNLKFCQINPINYQMSSVNCQNYKNLS